MGQFKWPMPQGKGPRQRIQDFDAVLFRRLGEESLGRGRDDAAVFGIFPVGTGGNAALGTKGTRLGNRTRRKALFFLYLAGEK